MPRPGFVPLRRVLDRVGVDFDPSLSPPSAAMVTLATAVAVAGSLAADAVLVAIGTTLFPSTANFSHFHLSDYGTLTVIGVVTACLAWPVVARISSAPRQLYLHAAAAVTLVLWVPDVIILLDGEPARGVGVLMVMHLAIALVGYNAMVRIAAVGRQWSRPVPHWARIERPLVWFAMAGLVTVEAVVGVVCLVLVPAGRPSEWFPSRSLVIYLVHGALGAVLAVTGLGVVVSGRRSSRPVMMCAVVGLVGVALGAAGGTLTAWKGSRPAGIVLMFVGAAAAILGYLMPAFETVLDPARRSADRGAAGGA